MYEQFPSQLSDRDTESFVGPHFPWDTERHQSSSKGHSERQILTTAALRLSSESVDTVRKPGNREKTLSKECIHPKSTFGHQL